MQSNQAAQEAPPTGVRMHDQRSLTATHLDLSLPSQPDTDNLSNAAVNGAALQRFVANSSRKPLFDRALSECQFGLSWPKLCVRAWRLCHT